MNDLINMMEQVKKLKNGIGVQSLLDSAYKILGNPIAMFNTEYNLLAYTEVVTDDSLWNELVTYGTFNKETQKFFENEGFIEDLANASRIAFMVSDKLKYNRITGKVFNKNNSYVSNLVIVACNKPFEKDDPMVFEAVCKLISKEISKSELYQEYEQSHQESVIKNLIDGNYDIKLDMGQVGILYDSLESNLYVAVVDISPCGSELTSAEHLISLLKQINTAYKYAVYSQCIIILISTNDDILNVNKDLKGLIKFLDQNNIYAGISSRFENLFELQKYYAEALKMLQYVSARKSAQRIFPCNVSSIGTMEKINTLENGLGIQYFLNIGPEIFGNPLLFHDMELNLLAYTENVEIIDPIWEELITYGTSSDETIELFRTVGFINTMENTKGGAVLISEKIKYDRISWRVYSNDNIMIGCLSIVNSMKPFTEDELVLFGAFSQKFSKEVGKIEFYNKYGQVYSDTVINRLLSGKIDDYTFYSEDIGNLYDNLMENIYLVVVDTSQCSSERVSLKYFRDMFNRLGTMNRYAIHDNYIVVIISTSSSSLTENKELHEISRIFEQNNIYAGISNRFDNIYELQSHYNEAVSVLRSGVKHGGQSLKKHFFQQDNVGGDG